MTLHVLHISKTGGTALIGALQSDDARRVLGDALVVHPHQVFLDDVPPPEQVIAVVRDPVTRFVSGFNSRLRQGRPQFDRPWSKDEAKAFRWFRTPGDLADALADGRRRARWAMGVIRHVNRPQVRWLGTADQLRQRADRLFFIGRQETLDADWLRLREMLGLPSSIDLPRDDIGAHRTPAGLPTNLTDRGRRAVEEWYADDRALLAVCDELRAGRL